MIMGFDHDDASIFDAQRKFITESHIAMTMIGMLHAIPKTPLHARLAEEGRLDTSDEPEFGTNIIPLLLSREELREGYVKVLNDLYSPEAYFGRTEALYLEKKIVVGRGRLRYWRKHPLKRLKTETFFLAQGLGLFARLLTGVPEASLRREYRRRLWRLVKVRQNPGVIFIYAVQCAMHYHAYTMARQMASGRSRIFNSF
jgi:hypothetical protein